MNLMIAMYHVTGVHVLGGLEQLVHYVTFVYVLENVASFDDVVQVGICASE